MTVFFVPGYKNTQGSASETSKIEHNLEKLTAKTDTANINNEKNETSARLKTACDI